MKTSLYNYTILKSVHEAVRTHFLLGVTIIKQLKKNAETCTDIFEKMTLVTTVSGYIIRRNRYVEKLDSQDIS